MGVSLRKDLVVTVKHLVWEGTLTLRAKRQSARLLKITNDGLTRSVTGSFMATVGVKGFSTILQYLTQIQTSWYARSWRYQHSVSVVVCTGIQCCGLLPWTKRSNTTPFLYCTTRSNSSSGELWLQNKLQLINAVSFPQPTFRSTLLHSSLLHKQKQTGIIQMITK